MTVEVLCGDCLEILPNLEAESVDVICTDPPYAQTNETRSSGWKDSDIACRPDVWRECYRVAAENAALVSFAGSPTYHRIATAVEAGGWKVRQMWAWVYRDGLITSAWPKEGFDRLAPAMDPIVFATKGKVLLNLEREGEAWEAWHEKKPTDSPLSGRSPLMAGVLKAEGHWPRTIFSEPDTPGFEYFSLPRTSNQEYRQERTGHPNQKPVSLLIRILSKLPGQVALDPFSGSGSTGVACLRLGKSAILVEQDAGYCEMARQRLAAERAKTPLFPEESTST